MQPSCQEGPHPRGWVFFMWGVRGPDLSEMSAVSNPLVPPPLFLKLIRIIQTFLFNTGHKQLVLLSNVIPGKEQIQFDHNLIIRFLALV